MKRRSRFDEVITLAYTAHWESDPSFSFNGIQKRTETTNYDLQQEEPFVDTKRFPLQWKHGYKKNDNPEISTEFN